MMGHFVREKNREKKVKLNNDGFSGSRRRGAVSSSSSPNSTPQKVKFSPPPIFHTYSRHPLHCLRYIPTLHHVLTNHLQTHLPHIPTPSLRVGLLIYSTASTYRFPFLSVPNHHIPQSPQSIRIPREASVCLSTTEDKSIPRHTQMLVSQSVKGLCYTP